MARLDLRPREGPLRRRRGQPRSRGLVQPPRPLSGKRSGQWSPGAAAAAEAAVSAVRPRPAAPPPRGSPGGKPLLPRESPLPGREGSLSPAASGTASLSLSSTTKLPPPPSGNCTLSSRVWGLPPVFFVFVFVWLLLLFSSSPLARGFPPPQPRSLTRCLRPELIVSFFFF